ncbi:C40 family peptidase [Sulfurovum sp. XGS-02]|uniref:C40 family peptidase n=1 Tax=Sulfurovum sp. XGS-02 TaxID=2925411 RepID=UPI00204851E8|nr:C40 family peptidase [Sulfurovum sp. XGS-02]UPT77927.1 C40 family peptidase [Sulfurovum sp. XGS-02]
MKVRGEYILLFISTLFLLNGCAQKKPYSYPNYDIIKPEKTCSPNRNNIQELLYSYLGKPYVWAEEGPYAFDCSGLTYNIYGSMGIDIPRVAREQAKMGKKVAFQNLHYGDLIFFGPPNKRSKRINHVGIYLGDGWFAHASSKERKVTVSHFEKEPIYVKRMKVCKRYLSEDERAKYMNCDVPLQKMEITTSRYTTPWQPGMKLPKKAVPS